MFTFGTVSTDRIDWTSACALQPHQANRTALTSIWLNPTTLTSGKAIWAWGSNWSVAIDTTTTSIRLIGTNGTTNSVWTFPAALAVNKMTFIAILVACGTNATTPSFPAVKAFVGTPTTAPVEVTVTNVTAGSGSFTSSNTTPRIGNSSGAAFLGQLGQFMVAVDDFNNSARVFGQATAGVLTQAETDRIAKEWVDPMWRGDVPKLLGAGRINQPVGASVRNGLQCIIALDGSVANAFRVNPHGIIVPSVTGASVLPATNVANPRPWTMHPENLFAPIGGRRFYSVAS